MIFKDGNPVGFVYKDGQAVEKIFQNGNLVFEQGFEREVSGVPPLTLNAVQNTAENYRIFGNNGGAGDKTQNLAPPLSEWTGGFIEANGNIAAPSSNTLEKLSPYIAVSPNQAYTFSYESGEFPHTTQSASWRAVGLYNEDKAFISRISAHESTALTFTAAAETAYIRLSFRTHGLTGNAVLNSGQTALPYEPYGYKIPVISGNQTTNIYLSEPLCNGDYVSYSEQAVHKSDSTVEFVELPEISLTKGLNTLNIGTAVQPSDVYIKYKGR